MNVNLAIRGFVDRRVLFEDRVEVEESALDEVIPGLVEKHAAAMKAHTLHMIEIEFLDELDEERFFRFGTDSRGMIAPIGIDLNPWEQP